MRMGLILIPDKTVERLSLYRWLLEVRVEEGTISLFSHQLAALACVTPAQVRRDLMAIGYSGSPNRGYMVKDLAASIARVLDGNEPTRVALVGMGNLGRAIVSFLRGRRTSLNVVATFDNNEKKHSRIICGVRCYPQNRIEQVVEEERISVAILTVPADSAQLVADKLVASGVTGILNYAPVPLRVPDWVHLENRDVTSALEKVSYFARNTAEGNNH
ncbi:redox-sensing transcriptional repressor Rex [Candidatus Fermentibacteria bacterium]|nr:MAG: redox-sensing transcriptional repressor Rex [Candidatus Fermentibacteria bacterium]